MKICVVLPCNIYNAPFYKRYENMLVEDSVKFDLVYWNRSNISEQFIGNSIPFNVYDNVNSGKYSKIFNYYRFAKFVKEQLKNIRYDRVIILGSYAGIMAQLSSFLNKNYCGKYWLDIRDYTFENIKLYYEMMKLAIKSSHTSVISSEGYKSFLPQHDYIIAHNIDYDNIKLSKEKRVNYIPNNPIRISFIGLVRYYEENKKLLNLFANDNRFRLQYYGMNSEELKKYCQQNNINNVDFYGRFLPSETAKFYKNTDIINNVYGNDSVAFTTALSNKLYFATGLKIPILVSKGTYMEKIAVKNGFGFAIDYKSNGILDNIYDWYTKLISNGNTANYTEFYDTALREDLIFKDRFQSFIK